MIRKADTSYAKIFNVYDTVTGAGRDADSLPAVTAIVNGTADAGFALTVENLATGRYRITGTIPAGYSDGDVVEVLVAATVYGVAAERVVDSFVVDSKLLDGMKVLMNKAVQDKATGVIRYYDDDGETEILRHTPGETETEITRMPS